MVSEIVFNNLSCLLLLILITDANIISGHSNLIYIYKDLAYVFVSGIFFGLTGVTSFPFLLNKILFASIWIDQIIILYYLLGCVF